MHICTYTCIGHGIKVFSIFDARWLRGAHMCTSGDRMDVHYIASLLLSIFEWFYAIMQGWGHVKASQGIF